MSDDATRSRVSPWLDDGDVQLYHGDVIDTLAALPASLVQTVVTSPPYWGLRDYGIGDGQIGLEATPDQYVERMVAVFREVWRVLRDDGTVWLNLGDSYASGNGGDTRSGFNERYFGKASTNDKQAETNSQLPPMRRPSGMKPKDLVGIPWRVAFALQTDGWYLRSDIVWSKPNPMPESVTDRPTKAHEYLFLLTKQARYMYDADAIREPHVDATRHAGHWTMRPNNGDGAGGLAVTGDYGRMGNHDAGRNRRSVWTIPTQPFPEAHFATYPQELVRPCILAGTSERGECSACGAPWQREVERVDSGQRQKMADGWDTGDGGHGTIHRNGRERGESGVAVMVPQTTGWTPSCTCDAPTRPQTVLDPFIGSGTTALVARKHGRRCIGIDLSAEYLEIAARRLQQLSLFADGVGA